MKKRFLILTMLLVSIFSFQSVSADSVVNLLPPNMDSSVSFNGLTVTHINNTYTFNGTSTNAGALFLLDNNLSIMSGGSPMFGLNEETGLMMSAGDYTLSFVEISGSTSLRVMFFIAGDDSLKESVYENSNTVTVNLSNKEYGFYLFINAGETYNDYTFSIQLEEGSTAHAYVDYVVPNASLSFITGFIAILSAWVTGFWGVVSSSINGAVIVFYDGTNLTTLGVLALFGLASGLVMFGLAFVKNLIKK